MNPTTDFQPARIGLGTALWRIIRLRCPRCGREKLFTGWFRMLGKCPVCGLDFHREPGFYLGSIYFNYGVTVVVMAAVFFGLWFGAGLDPDVLLWPTFGFCLLFPIWFFRYARALWLAFDCRWDPQQPPAES